MTSTPPGISQKDGLDAGSSARTCAHCGGPLPAESAVGEAFCCRGCHAAWELVQGLGLSSYYQRRCLDPDTALLRPDSDVGSTDLGLHVQTEADGSRVLHLMVEGIHCAACVWLIETVLSRQPGVFHARLNMTTRRLVVRWKGDVDSAGADNTGADKTGADKTGAGSARAGDGSGAAGEANRLVEPVTRLGYRLVPYDPALLGNQTRQHESQLLRAMAVSGFAAGNIMLLSVSIWAGVDMGEHTRELFHWLSALIAFPAVAYCIRPFSRPAFQALRHGRTNMDVPITLGVTLTVLMSLWETIQRGQHAYFDASVTLLFFLLIGRYLDSRARGQARSAAEHLLALGAQAVTVLREDGGRVMMVPTQVQAGMTVLVAAGERIGIDGAVAAGESAVDCSLITGESLPSAVQPGSRVFAGTLNLDAPLTLTVQAVGEGTLLAEIVRMMEVSEQGRARYVALADRVARYYAPVVHVMALATFTGWRLLTPVDWQVALMTAVSVLIVTCPCAIALAVPVVQVIASGRLLRRGILLKSPTALERITGIDTVVFDKTGTLTLGRPRLLRQECRWTDSDLRQAASMAACSRHPLARALAAEVMVPVADGVREITGQGLEMQAAGGPIRLGSRTFCLEPQQLAEAPPARGPELWFSRPGQPPVCFCLADNLREDAAEVVQELQRNGLQVELLSGDRTETVEAIAAAAGISRWQGLATPADKCARLEALRAGGRKVLMVGDGLNDAPALAAADVSLSPSSAVDVSQTTADAIFQGERLAPVVELLHVARFSDRLVRQNFALALGYNVITIPLAMAGKVTPLIAAIAMSTSSVVVIINALRLARGARS